MNKSISLFSLNVNNAVLIHLFFFSFLQIPLQWLSLMIMQACTLINMSHELPVKIGNKNGQGYEVNENTYSTSLTEHIQPYKISKTIHKSQCVHQRLCHRNFLINCSFQWWWYQLMKTIWKFSIFELACA